MYHSLTHVGMIDNNVQHIHVYMQDIYNKKIDKRIGSENWSMKKKERVALQIETEEQCC